MRRAGIITMAILLLFIQIAKSDPLEFGKDIESNPFAIEESRLTIFVGCNGTGVDNADIYIEREGIIKMINKTNETGYAVFDLPSINFSIPCKIKALKHGYEAAQSKIWIMKKPKLYISAPKIVEEGKEIEIKVIDQDLRGVSDALLSIGNEQVITNETGCYRYRIPNVGFSTYLKLEARKDGYEKSDEIRLWIADNRSSILSAPLWVFEGETFGIDYNGSDDVTIYFGETPFDRKSIEIKAPYVNETKVYQIRAMSNGSLLDYRFIVVLDRSERALILSPSTVFEESGFGVYVISLENLEPIKGVKLMFSGNTRITDEDGKADFNSPKIGEDYRLYSIYVLDTNVSADPRYLWVEKSEKLSLIIDGPSMVKSGENVTFNITDIKRNRVFAILYIENLSFYAFNGSANIKIPDVDRSRYAYLRAKSPGYAEAEKIIYVVAKEKKINIVCEDSIKEGERFSVNVMDQDGYPVKEATIWFNFRYYESDEHGKVDLTAPDVLLSTRYLIYAEKDGYIPASRWITVVESGIGKKFMKIISPLAVSPWQNLEVRIMGSHGEGIGEADVEMRYGTMVLLNKTNKEGYVKFTVPPLGDDDYITLIATKEGYIQDSLMIHLISRSPNLPDLKIYPSKTSLMEGESLVLQIKDGKGEPVEGAYVWIDGRLYQERSDTYGILTCKAPSVDIDRSCFIYTSKEGYNFGYTWINVINRIEFEEPLNIETNASVYEGEGFDVKVLDSSGDPLKGVYVWFNSIKRQTDFNGIASFVAPYVNKDSYMLIGVESKDHVPSYRLIKILDKYSEGPYLNISVPPKIFEGEYIDVVVKDAYGYIVKEATIIINGRIAGYSDENGRFRFRAPEVDHDSTIVVVAIKSGYISASKQIEIKDIKKSFIEENWYLIPAVVMIVVIAIVAYFYYRQYVI